MDYVKTLTTLSKDVYDTCSQTYTHTLIFVFSMYGDNAAVAMERLWALHKLVCLILPNSMCICGTEVPQ